MRHANAYWSGIMAILVPFRTDTNSDTNSGTAKRGRPDTNSGTARAGPPLSHR